MKICGLYGKGFTKLFSKRLMLLSIVFVASLLVLQGVVYAQTTNPTTETVIYPFGGGEVIVHSTSVTEVTDVSLRDFPTSDRSRYAILDISSLVRSGGVFYTTLETYISSGISHLYEVLVRLYNAIPLPTRDKGRYDIGGNYDTEKLGGRATTNVPQMRIAFIGTTENGSLRNLTFHTPPSSGSEVFLTNTLAKYDLINQGNVSQCIVSNASEAHLCISSNTFAQDDPTVFVLAIEGYDMVRAVLGLDDQGWINMFLSNESVVVAPGIDEAVYESLTPNEKYAFYSAINRTDVLLFAGGWDFRECQSSGNFNYESRICETITVPAGKQCAGGTKEHCVLAPLSVSFIEDNAIVRYENSMLPAMHLAGVLHITAQTHPNEISLSQAKDIVLSQAIDLDRNTNNVFAESGIDDETGVGVMKIDFRDENSNIKFASSSVLFSTVDPRHQSFDSPLTFNINYSGAVVNYEIPVGATVPAGMSELVVEVQSTQTWTVNSEDVLYATSTNVDTSVRGVDVEIGGLFSAIVDLAQAGNGSNYVVEYKEVRTTTEGITTTSLSKFQNVSATGSPPPPTVPPVTPTLETPSTPTGLTESVVDRKVTLSWQKPDSCEECRYINVGPLTGSAVPDKLLPLFVNTATFEFPSYSAVTLFVQYVNASGGGRIATLRVNLSRPGIPDLDPPEIFKAVIDESDGTTSTFNIAFLEPSNHFTSVEVSVTQEGGNSYSRTFTAGNVEYDLGFSIRQNGNDVTAIVSAFESQNSLASSSIAIVATEDNVPPSNFSTSLFRNNLAVGNEDVTFTIVPTMFTESGASVAVQVFEESGAAVGNPHEVITSTTGSFVVTGLRNDVRHRAVAFVVDSSENQNRSFGTQLYFTPVDLTSPPDPTALLLSVVERSTQEKEEYVVRVDWDAPVNTEGDTTYVLSTASHSVEGVSTHTSVSSNAFDVVFNSDGELTMMISLCDEADNCSSGASTTIQLVDTTPLSPVQSLDVELGSTPQTSNAGDPITTVTVTATAPEYTGDISSIVVYASQEQCSYSAVDGLLTPTGGLPFNQNGASFTRTFSLCLNGYDGEISAVVFDNAGNRSATITTLVGVEDNVVEDIAPSASLDLSLSTNTGTVASMSFVLTDPDRPDDISHYKYTVDQAFCGMLPVSSTFSTASGEIDYCLNGGEVIVTITAVDFDGNVGSDSLVESEVSIDNLPPALPQNCCSTHGEDNGFAVTMIVPDTEDPGFATSIVLVFDGPPPRVFGYSYADNIVGRRGSADELSVENFPFPSYFTDGTEYFFSIYFRDDAGNQSSSQRYSVTPFDDVPPMALPENFIQAPSLGSPNSPVSDVDIRISFGNAYYDLAGYSAALTQENCAFLESGIMPTTYTTTYLAANPSQTRLEFDRVCVNGEDLIVHVMALDDSGNLSEASSRTFTIADMTPPTGTSILSSRGEIEGFSVDWEIASDDDASSRFVCVEEFSADSQCTVVDSSTTSYSVTGDSSFVEDSIYNIFIRSQDSDNNVHDSLSAMIRTLVVPRIVLSTPLLVQVTPSTDALTVALLTSRDVNMFDVSVKNGNDQRQIFQMASSPTSDTPANMFIVTNLAPATTYILTVTATYTLGGDTFVKEVETLTQNNPPPVVENATYSLSLNHIANMVTYQINWTDPADVSEISHFIVSFVNGSDVDDTRMQTVATGVQTATFSFASGDLRDIIAIDIISIGSSGGTNSASPNLMQ